MSSFPNYSLPTEAEDRFAIWYRNKDGRAFWCTQVLCDLTPVTADVGKYETRRRKELEMEWYASRSLNSWEEMLLQKLMKAEEALAARAG